MPVRAWHSCVKCSLCTSRLPFTTAHVTVKGVEKAKLKFLRATQLYLRRNLQLQAPVELGFAVLVRLMLDVERLGKGGANAGASFDPQIKVCQSTLVKSDALGQG